MLSIESDPIRSIYVLFESCSLDKSKMLIFVFQEGTSFVFHMKITKKVLNLLKANLWVYAVHGCPLEASVVLLIIFNPVGFLNAEQV